MSVYKVTEEENKNISEEIKGIFLQLSPENQMNLLELARTADKVEGQQGNKKNKKNSRNKGNKPK